MLVLALCTPAGAAPADLDSSFGGDGVVPVRWPSGGGFADESLAHMAIGPRDEIVVLTSNYACTWQFECPTELALTRYDAAGKRDPSFGIGPGSRLVVQEGPERHPLDLAIGADGKTVIAAYDDSKDGGLRVWRFDRAGRPDPTFGVGGEAPQPLSPGWSSPVVVAVQPDGKVVLATEGSMVEDGQELRIVRYLTNGALDPSFGGSGEVRLTLPTQTRPADLLLDPQGAITVASPYCCVGGTRLFGGGFSIARVLGDGTPDPGLAGNGRLFFPTPGAEGTVVAIALAPDGGAFVLFEERTERVMTFGNVVKLSADGSVDGAFGSEGRLQLFPRLGEFIPTALLADRRGRLIGVGRGEDGVAAFRLRPDGSLDRTFNGGRQATVLGGGKALALALQSSGRIVVLGTPTYCCGPRNFVLAGLRGGTDRTRCLGHRATIVGTRGRDVLTGTPHRDVIAALAAADVVRGLSGQDLICGGKGPDHLLGGSGRDSVQQQPGGVPVVR